MVPVRVHIISRFLTQAALIKVTLARKHGLKPFELLALALFDDHQRLPMKELRAAFCLSPTSLSSTVQSLENRGLVTRLQSQEDKRRWFLRLSPRGKKLYARMLEAETNAITILDGFSDAEITALISLSQAMRRLPGKRRGRAILPHVEERMSGERSTR